MFKRIFAFVLTFVMAASLFTVNAADNEVFKGERGEFSYFIDGEAFDPSEKVPAGKTVDVKVRVRNDMSSSRFFTLLTALYNSEGAMVTVENTRLWIGTGSSYDKQVLTLNITAPAQPVNEMYDVKSFVWENTSTLVPCQTVVTEVPVPPSQVTVTKTADKNVIGWNRVDASGFDLYGYIVYRDGVEIGTVKQTTSTAFYSYEDTAENRSGEYKVVAYGLNDSVMSVGVNDITETDYNTDTLALNEIKTLLNGDIPWNSTGSGVKYLSYKTTGGLALFMLESTISAAYDANFATNKTAYTFGFCEKTDADGVTKECLASNYLKQDTIRIKVIDEEILSSKTKIVKMTVLDNKKKELTVRYAPTTGSRKTFKFNLTGSGKWVTLLAVIDDTYTGDASQQDSMFELGNGSYDFPEEVYIADISISTPITTPAE